MNRNDQIKAPAFDPEIIARHITRDFILTCMQEAHSETTTDDNVYANVPSIHAGQGGRLDAAHGNMMIDKIMAVLEELRSLGRLEKIPAGEERGLPEVKAWNRFVENGAAAFENWDLHALMRCPLPNAINQGAWSAVYETVKDMRMARGLDLIVDGSATAGPKASFQITLEDLETLATAAALGAVSRGCGMTTEIMIGRSELRCRKTDELLEWKEAALLAPIVGKWHYPDRASGLASYFEPVVPMEIPKPIRQVEFTLPSGILMMADWFRIPGFTEGVGKDDYSKPSINSDLGIDERTRDHYERLGLMRIHTGNCVPNLIKDGEAIRVGYFDEDHEAFWTEDGDRSEVAMPEMAGRVCCDLWDVTFADRDILIDILMAGAAAIEANGGIGDREREVTGYPTSREEAGQMLDAYAEDSYVPRLEFEPGTVLQVTMATGHGSMDFHNKFRSADLSDWPAMEDMFILSVNEIRPDPKIEADVEKADWSWPERYSNTPSPSCDM